MFRLLPAGIALVLVISSLACGDYSTGLQRSAGAADETAAISTLRTVKTAQVTYSVSNDGAYGTFAELCAAGYLDDRFNSSQPEVRGFLLTMTVDNSGRSFSCNADPAPDGKQPAARHFYIDSTSDVIHVHPSQPAAAADPQLN